MNPEVLKAEVRRRYAEAAAGGSCCGPAASPAAACGPRAASEEPAELPAARELDLGCGNPLPFAGIRPGDILLDLGCGSGAEVLRAARIVGPSGKAIGVDMTDEMLELAGANLRVSGLTNVEFLKGEIEALPLPDASVDVILSNCVLNLSPDKPSAFGEAFRVLRPGGRFVVADVVIPGAVEPDPDWRSRVSAWTSCEAGALTEAEYRRGLEGAGFSEVRLERIATYTGDGCCAEGADPPAAGGAGGGTALASDLISARKPGAP